jgi:hypothetical protein
LRSGHRNEKHRRSFEDERELLVGCHRRAVRTAFGIEIWNLDESVATSGISYLNLIDRYFVRKIVMCASAGQEQTGVS